MTYAFTGRPAAAPPGLEGAGPSETLFPQDPVLAQAAGPVGGDVCRRQDETFCLAYPWDPAVPFP